MIKDYDFRQGEIKECWDEHLSDEGNRVFTIATVRMNCSGGTYVRSLVHSLGKKLSVGATTLHILRERVGEYTI